MPNDVESCSLYKRPTCEEWISDSPDGLRSSRQSSTLVSLTFSSPTSSPPPQPKSPSGYRRFPKPSAMRRHRSPRSHCTVNSPSPLTSVATSSESPCPSMPGSFPLAYPHTSINESVSSHTSTSTATATATATATISQPPTPTIFSQSTLTNSPRKCVDVVRHPITCPSFHLSREPVASSTNVNTAKTIPCIASTSKLTTSRNMYRHSPPVLHMCPAVTPHTTTLPASRVPTYNSTHTSDSCHPMAAHYNVNQAQYHKLTSHLSDPLTNSTSLKDCPRPMRMLSTANQHPHPLIIRDTAYTSTDNSACHFKHPSCMNYHQPSCCPTNTPCHLHHHHHHHLPSRSTHHPRTIHSPNPTVNISDSQSTHAQHCGVKPSTPFAHRTPSYNSDSLVFPTELSTNRHHIHQNDRKHSHSHQSSSLTSSLGLNLNSEIPFPYASSPPCYLPVKALCYTPTLDTADAHSSHACKHNCSSSLHHTNDSRLHCNSTRSNQTTTTGIPIYPSSINTCDQPEPSRHLKVSKRRKSGQYRHHRRTSSQGLLDDQFSHHTRATSRDSVRTRSIRSSSVNPQAPSYTESLPSGRALGSICSSISSCGFPSSCSALSRYSASQSFSSASSDVTTPGMRHYDPTCSRKSYTCHRHECNQHHRNSSDMGDLDQWDARRRDAEEYQRKVQNHAYMQQCSCAHHTMERDRRRGRRRIRDNTERTHPRQLTKHESHGGSNMSRPTLSVSTAHSSQHSHGETTKLVSAQYHTISPSHSRSQLGSRPCSCSRSRSRSRRKLSNVASSLDSSSVYRPNRSVSRSTDSRQTSSRRHRNNWHNNASNHICTYDDDGHNVNDNNVSTHSIHANHLRLRSRSRSISSLSLPMHQYPDNRSIREYARSTNSSSDNKPESCNDSDGLGYESCEADHGDTHRSNSDKNSNSGSDSEKDEAQTVRLVNAKMRALPAPSTAEAPTTTTATTSTSCTSHRVLSPARVKMTVDVARGFDLDLGDQRIYMQPLFSTTHHPDSCAMANLTIACKRCLNHDTFHADGD